MFAPLPSHGSSFPSFLPFSHSTRAAAPQATLQLTVTAVCLQTWAFVFAQALPRADSLSLFLGLIQPGVFRRGQALRRTFSIYLVFTAGLRSLCTGKMLNYREPAHRCSPFQNISSRRDCVRIFAPGSIFAGCPGFWYYGNELLPSWIWRYFVHVYLLYTRGENFVWTLRMKFWILRFVSRLVLWKPGT